MHAGIDLLNLLPQSLRTRKSDYFLPLTAWGQWPLSYLSEEMKNCKLVFYRCMHVQDPLVAKQNYPSKFRQETHQYSSTPNRMTQSTFHVKNKKWPPYFALKLSPSNRVKDQWIPNQTSKMSNGTQSLITRDISYNQKSQIYIHLNDGITLKWEQHYPERMQTKGSALFTNCKCNLKGGTKLLVHENAGNSSPVSWNF